MLQRSMRPIMVYDQPGTSLRSPEVFADLLGVKISAIP